MSEKAFCVGYVDILLGIAKITCVFQVAYVQIIQSDLWSASECFY